MLFCGELKPSHVAEMRAADFIALLEDPYIVKRPVITTKCKEGGFFSSALHVLVVQCDSEQAATSAMNSLHDLWGFESVMVEWQPGKFWIVSDHVDRIGRVLKMMRKVVGADQVHVEESKEVRAICLRASPTHEGYPRFVQSFVGDPALTNKAHEWFSRLSLFFTSSQYIEVVRKLKTSFNSQYIKLNKEACCPQCASQRRKSMCAECGHEFGVFEPVVPVEGIKPPKRSRGTSGRWIEC